MGNYKYANDVGIIYPDTSSVKKDVGEWWANVTGDSTPVHPSSLEGRIIDAETIARLNTLEYCCFIANQINPNFATGSFLDSLCMLTRTERRKSEHSMAQCALKGSSGVVVPQGSKAIDKSGNSWFLPYEIKLDGSTSGVVTTFICEKSGEIFAKAGDINRIATTVTGWDSIESVSDSTIGSDTQSDESLRYFRRRELAKNAQSNSYAVISSISALRGVKRVNYYENVKPQEITYHGITMKPHSTYVCVDGGVDYEIAEAYQVRSGGASYSCSTTHTKVEWEDPYSKQKIDVLFDRPVLKPVSIKLIIKSTTTTVLSEDIISKIIEYSKIESSDNGFTLGVDTSAFEIASYLSKKFDDMFIVKCEIGLLSTGNTSCDLIVNKINEKSTIVESNISIEVQ